MTTEPGKPGPEQAQQMWEAGARSLSRLAAGALLDRSRELERGGARWGSSRLGPAMSSEALAAWRELNEAAFAVGQAWMRLPLALSSGAPPAELQAAVTRLTEAQGRAYKLWMEAIQKMGEMAKPGSGPRSP